MDLKILKFLVTIVICSRLTHQITTPEDRCQISESGFVCLDCFTKGTCFLNEEDETYSVIFESSCQDTPEQFYCDDTISHPQNFGSCSLLDAAATDCSCSSSDQCIADVNNPAVVLHCEDDTPVSDPPCFFPSLDLDTCNCASYSDDTCFFTKDPNGDCTSYFLYLNNTLTPLNCSAGTCFNQTECKCVKTQLTCDKNCPLVDNPDGDCKSYYVCSNDNLTPLNCSEGLCFDQEFCGCVASTTPSTISSSTISSTTISSSTIPLTNCSTDCPFLDNPDGNCQSYFVCSGTGLTPVNCSENLCFDQASCSCVPTCPPGCPFIGNPSGDCKSYFVCTGTALTPITCADNLCFDQESCSCVPATGSTTPPPTCSSDCPFVDDPNDNCQSYFVCNGNELSPVNCSLNTCFDQESCGCVVKTTTKISTTTSTPTCPSGCPFVDDPNDDTCHKFFICDGTDLISQDCPGTLCFVQETCQCQ